MELVTNHGALSHRAAIEQVLHDAQEATVSVAFLKVGGAQFLEPLLDRLLAGGGRAIAFIGTDFFLTEPDALAVLLDLAERRASFEVFVGRRARATFHPKVYSAVKGKRFHCLIGSANLTGGALGANDETSLLVEDDTGSSLHRSLQSEWARLGADPRFRQLDRLGLAQYRASWRPIRAPRLDFEKAIAEAGEEEFDLTQIDANLALYQEDERAKEDLVIRNGNRASARRVQTALANMDTAKPLTAADRALFRTRLTDLMTGKGDARHLWPSDAIFRQGTKTLSHPREMIRLFKLGQQASKRPLAEGFDLMRSAAQKIPGAGVNMITVILSTFAPNRYAVLNGNTATALRSLGFDAPKTLTVKNLNGTRYAEVADVIGALRDRIGADDFPETDAFLNWLYQRL